MDRSELIESPATEIVEDRSMRFLEYAVGALAGIAALILGFLR